MEQNKELTQKPAESSPVDLGKVREILAERLVASGWTQLLRGFLYSSDFDLILQQLYDLKQDGKRFTPPLKQVFRAFEECPLKDTKVVIIGQDPYPYMGVADGIAFSCANGSREQPSLTKIFNAIKSTVYTKDAHLMDRDTDLGKWAYQGVLLLNKALTCQLDKPGTHYDIWHPFLAYVLDALNNHKERLVFVLMGKAAQELEDLIGEQHHIIKVSHPASAAYAGTDWDCKDCFNEINRELAQLYGPETSIHW